MKIRLLASSDVHGYVMPYRYSDLKPCDHGFLKLKATMDAYTTTNTLKIDNGDVLEGSPYLGYYYRHRDLYAKNPMIDAVNGCHYDYYNIGNHDFNYGQANLLDYIKQNNALGLCGNVKYHGEYLGAKYRIHEFDAEHKIALIGVVTHYIENWEKPESLVGYEIVKAFDYVKETVEEIKANEKVNGIVVVYHGGFEKDLDTGVPTEELTGENEAYRMCQEIKGIDVLISGHQHRSIAQKCLGVSVTQTAHMGQEIAMINWDLDTHEISEELIPCTYEPDSKFTEKFIEIENGCEKWLDQPLGRIMDADLKVSDEFAARLHKHPVITFINKVQLDASGADLAGNALFNGAVGFNESITMRDIVSTYVYPNTLVVFKINGKILKEYLEKNAEYFDVQNDEIVVDYSYAYPKPQHYNYDMVDGVDYTIKVSNPKGSRIVDLKYNGQEVSDDQEFKLAINNYRAAGGGNFFMFKNAPRVLEMQEDMVTLLSNYLIEHKEVYLNHYENIHVIK